MSPVSLIAYVDYMVELTQKGQFESYFCQDCLVEKNFDLEYLPTEERQTDTAFCEGCHVCKPVSNPYINQYVHSLITPLSDDPGTAWYSSEAELVYYNLQGRGYRSEAWLMAQNLGISYEIAFQRNLKRRLTPYWRRPGYGRSNFLPGALERMNEEADFIEASVKRIYGATLFPLSPAPDYLIDHPVSEVVTDFARFLIELAKTGCWEDLYCETCQQEHLHIEPRYLPFMHRESAYAYLEDTGLCSRCSRCNDVSNPGINKYIIDRYPAFTYPRRQECNSDTYIIRDVLASGQLRVRCSQTAHNSANSIHEGMTADQIYRYEYHKAIVQSLNSEPGLLTPPHARLFNETYQAILGPELMPLSERILFPRENSGRASSPGSVEFLTGRKAPDSGSTLRNTFVQKYLSLQNKFLNIDFVRFIKKKDY